MTEQDDPQTDSLLKATLGSRLPGLVRGFRQTVKDWIRPPAPPSAKRFLNAAPKRSAPRQEERPAPASQMDEKHPAPSRSAPRLTEEAREIRKVLGENTVKHLLAGDLHPKKLKAVFSILEAAHFGHAAQAGSKRPPMPAMPKDLMSSTCNEATPPAKAGASSRGPSDSSASLVDPGTASTVAGAANAPAAAQPVSLPAPRSREMLPKARTDRETEARQELQQAMRSRGSSLGR